MRCEYCNTFEAIAIIYDENEYKFKYICDNCLYQFIQTFGEVNLDYEPLNNPLQLIEWLKNTANEEIEYREEKLKIFRKMLYKGSDGKW